MKNIFTSLKSRKITAITVSSILIILGILFFIPEITRQVFEIVCALLLVMMGVAAIYSIVRYTTSKEKNGWMLAQGILYGILFILVIIAIALNGQIAFANYAWTIFWFSTTFLGFISIFSGIMRITTSSVSSHPTYLVIYGVIQIIIGSVLSFGIWFCYTNEDLYIIMCFLASYALVTGLNLLIMTLSNSDLRKDEKDFNVIDGDDLTK